MARNTTGRRATIASTRPSYMTAAPAYRYGLTQYAPRPSLALYEDLRRWHPMRDVRPAIRTTGRVATLAVRPTATFNPMGGLRSFTVPANVVTCVRRKMRREVLFAMGKSGGGKRRPSRTWRSNVKC